MSPVCGIFPTGAWTFSTVRWGVWAKSKNLTELFSCKIKSDKRKGGGPCIFTMGPMLVKPWSCGHPCWKIPEPPLTEQTRTNMSARSTTGVE